MLLSVYLIQLWWCWFWCRIIWNMPANLDEGKGLQGLSRCINIKLLVLIDGAYQALPGAVGEGGWALCGHTTSDRNHTRRHDCYPMLIRYHTQTKRDCNTKKHNRLLYYLLAVRFLVHTGHPTFRSFPAAAGGFLRRSLPGLRDSEAQNAGSAAVHAEGTAGPAGEERPLDFVGSHWVYGFGSFEACVKMMWNTGKGRGVAKKAGLTGYFQNETVPVEPIRLVPKSSVVMYV